MDANKQTVLITTSGTGNRLGNLTKYTNKSLVRVGKKPAISYIIESYPENTQFVITTGYYGDHVKQYVKLAYPDKSFIFCDVDKFEGKGSSLLYSMYCAKNHLQTPFIFHACDTILSETPVQSRPQGNWCASSYTTHREHYRMHRLMQGAPNILNIDEKGSNETTHAHIGISHIENYKEFWESAESLLKDFPEDQSLSDCHVINVLIERGYRFTPHFIENRIWFDIGNISGLNHAREHIPDKFHILDKDDESIFIFNNSVIKFFNDKKTVANRITRLKYLKELGPTLLDSTDNFYKYEYINGIEASHLVDIPQFKNLLNQLQSYWTLIEKNKTFIKKTDKFYFTKTRDRASQFASKYKIKDQMVKINGVDVPPIDTLLNSIVPSLITTSNKYYFHGDCVLDNIIITPTNEVKFIDWRQDFCGEIDGGDIYYDLAKLAHSLVINHDLISKNLFSYKEQEIDGIKCIQVDILRKSSHIEFEKLLFEFAEENKFDTQRINIIKALIWINMSPLHHYPFNYFLYYYGLYHLNKFIKNETM